MLRGSVEEEGVGAIVTVENLGDCDRTFELKHETWGLPSPMGSPLDFLGAPPVRFLVCSAQLSCRFASYHPGPLLVFLCSAVLHVATICWGFLRLSPKPPSFSLLGCVSVCVCVCVHAHSGASAISDPLQPHGL